MRTIIKPTDEIYEAAAAHIINTATAKQDAVIAVSSGNTMKKLVEALSALKAASNTDFAAVRLLSVASILDADGKVSCAELNEYANILGVKKENVFFPTPEKPESYDELISQLGGIDLAVLGIGEDAHIGYNEPGTLYDTKTHIRKLTDRTKRQLRKRGYTGENMPELAVTMGIKTITSARNIMVAASGEDKSAPVYQMMYAKTMPYIPASFLQIPLEVTVYLDTQAASKL